MKPMISFFSLTARLSIYRIAADLAIMAALQLTAFTAAAKNIKAVELMSRPLYLGICFCSLCFFILTMIHLCVSGIKDGAQSSYTLQRLGLDLREMYLCRFVYAAAVLLIFAAVQALVIFAMTKICSDLNPEYPQTAHSMFLTLNRMPFFHAFVPDSDVMLWIRNAAMLLAAASECARIGIRSFKEAESESSASFVFSMALLAATFSSASQSFIWSLLLFVTFAVLAIMSLIRGLTLGKEDAE